MAKTYADSLVFASTSPWTILGDDIVRLTGNVSVANTLTATGLLTASGQIVTTTITAEAANKLYLDSNGFTIIDDGWYTYGTTFNPGWGTDAAMIGYINFYSGHGGAGYYRDIGIGDGATYGYLFWVDGSDRFVGINRQTAVGTEDFGVNGDAYIGGDCSALTFTDRTPWDAGDALSELLAVRGDGNGNIDHDTLGKAKSTFNKINRFTEIRDKKTNGLLHRTVGKVEPDTPDKKYKDIYLTKEKLAYDPASVTISEATEIEPIGTRNVSVSLSQAIRAIQQLEARIKALEAQP